MASIFDDPSLQQARSAAQTAQSTASSESAASITLPDMLRDALNKKFASPDNPLIQEREQAMNQYLTSTTEAPLRVTPKSAGGYADVIYNPLQQANLIQGYRAPSIARLGTLNDLLGLQTGGMENVIGATSRAHQASVQGLQNQAQLAQQNYKDVLGELSARAEEAAAQEKARSAGGGGGDFDSLLAALLPSLMGGRQEPEAKPFSLPVAPGKPLNPNQLYFSPGEQWVFDFETMDWAPVTD